MSVPPRRVGRMAVFLTVHGGTRALADVTEGMVVRNVRSIREGVVPPLASSQVRFEPGPVWQDAVTALRERRATAGALAAWRAAERRVQTGSDEFNVGILRGAPVVTIRSGSLTRIEEDPAQVFGGGVPYTQPIVGATEDPREGRVVQQLALTIDDDLALPVREIGDTMARHNARRIVKKNLPCIYKAGVHYEVEGSPERWWDAEEIILNGYDDCEGLASWRAGELLLAGLDAHVHTRQIQIPEAFAGGRKGGRLFHALARVDRADGTFVVDDPSIRLGMPIPRWYLDFARKRRAAGQEL